MLANPGGLPSHPVSGEDCGDGHAQGAASWKLQAGFGICIRWLPNMVRCFFGVAEDHGTRGVEVGVLVLEMLSVKGFASGSS